MGFGTSYRMSRIHFPQWPWGLIWESGWVSMGQVCCSDRLALHPQWVHRENTFSLVVEIQSGPWGPGEERWRTVHGPPVHEVKRAHIVSTPSPLAELVPWVRMRAQQKRWEQTELLCGSVSAMELLCREGYLWPLLLPCSVGSFIIRVKRVSTFPSP